MLAIEINEFQKDVSEKISLYFGSDYEIKPVQVTKNNGVHLTGICIGKPEESMRPTIYLNDYYLSYKAGREMDEIVEDIYQSYLIAKNNVIQKNRLELDYINCKDKIVIRLVNYEENRELLESVPHVKFLDMAVIYTIIVNSTAENFGSIRITRDLLKNWNVPEEELKHCALRNTPIMLPAVYEPMSKVIQKMMFKQLEENQYDEEMIREFLNSLEEETEKGKATEMYVLTNTLGINGAACILYPNLLREIAKDFNNDFYILPSSIHETLLIPVKEGMKVEDLRNMVKEVNMTQVAEEERLSNNVYLYSREQGSITML